MRMTLIGAVAFLLATGGLAFAQAIKTPAQIQSQEQQLIGGASGNQAGTLEQFTDKSLTLKPYQAAAGVAQMQLDQSAQVYATVPNGLITTQLANASLAPGANVRVYFQAPSGKQPPKVVAIELLPETEAAALKQSESGAPKK